MDRPVTFYFTRGALRVVIALEVVVSLGGSALGVAIIFCFPDLDVRLRAVLVSMSFGLSGSGSYYLRRIYKAAFDDRLRVVEPTNSQTERIATSLYLLGRPVIAISLSIAVALGIILTYTMAAPDGVKPTSDLVYLAGSLGFATGFLNGRIIERLESSGKL